VLSKKPKSLSPSLQQSSIIQLPQIKKINFFDYAKEKNLGSDATTKLQDSSISLSNRSSFKPSFYSKNPSRIDELTQNKIKEKDWLVG
jgi:hypothetical protein